jgi:hypothetical protein
MEKLELPSVGADAKLKDAIDLLKSAKNYALGVVADLPSGPVVLDVDLILHTLNEKGNVGIATVKPRIASLRLPKATTAERVLTSAKSWADIRRLLDAKRAGYAVARIHDGIAELIARHETYAGILWGEPSIRECTRDGKFWLVQDLDQPNNQCPDHNVDTTPI